MSRFRLGTWFLGAILFMVGMPVLAEGPINLSGTETDVTGMVLAADAGGQTHAVWSDGGALYHRVLSGGQWGVAQQVATGWQPDLVAGADGTLHLVYVAQPDSAQDVLYANWLQADGWSLPTNVSQSTNDSGAPSVAWCASGLAISWSEFGTSGSLIMWAESTDGAQWTTAPVPQAEGTSPQVVFGPDGALTVVWEDVFDLGFPLEIMASTRVAGAGAEWSLPEDVSFTIGETSTSPTCVSGGAAVWLAWEEVGTDGTIIMATSLVGGEWSTSAAVTASGDHGCPSLAVDPQERVHLAWLNGADIHRASMAEVSAHWAMDDPLSTGSDHVSALSLAMGDDAVAGWLAGEEGIDRDAWAAAWPEDEAADHCVLLPLVVR